MLILRYLSEVKNNKHYIELGLKSRINDEVITFNLTICEEAFNCLKSSSESLSYDSCISCKEGYYPFYNTSFINNSFHKCYSIPEGYYFNEDEKILNHCYHSCKKCSYLGNEENHNCIECKNNYIYEMKINNSLNCYNTCNNYTHNETEGFTASVNL